MSNQTQTQWPQSPAKRDLEHRLTSGSYRQMALQRPGECFPIRAASADRLRISNTEDSVNASPTTASARGSGHSNAGRQAAGSRAAGATATERPCVTRIGAGIACNQPHVDAAP